MTHIVSIRLCMTYSEHTLVRQYSSDEFKSIKIKD